MKKIMSIITVVGLFFSLSIGIIYADSKDIPEGPRVYLQYGYASSSDTSSSSSYNYRTDGTCTNSQAVVAVYVRDKDRKPKSQNSCNGLNASTYTIWYSSGRVEHIHTASSIIPR